MVRREPRRKRRVRKDVLALGERLPQGPREVRHPLLRRAVAPVHRSQILVVHVDPVQPVALHPLRHRVRGADRVRTCGGGGVGRAECGGDDLDAGVVVFVQLCGLVGGGEGGEPAGLVECASEGEEGERDDVVALSKSECQSQPSLGEDDQNAHPELSGGREDAGDPVVRVDDKARGGRDGARREGGDVAVDGGGGSEASGSQREGGEDSGDHASVGEHL